MFVAASSDPSVRRGRPTSVDPFQGVTNVTRRFDEGMHSNPLTAKGHQRARLRQPAPPSARPGGRQTGQQENWAAHLSMKRPLLTDRFRRRREAAFRPDRRTVGTPEHRAGRTGMEPTGLAIFAKLFPSLDPWRVRQSVCPGSGFLAWWVLGCPPRGRRKSLR